MLVEGVSEESEWVLRGRAPWQAPDVDGQVFLPTSDTIRVGDIVPVRITQAAAYDLVGEPAV